MEPADRRYERKGIVSPVDFSVYICGLTQTYTYLLETVSLRAVICSRVRVPASEPTQTLRKRDPHWEELYHINGKSAPDLVYYQFSYGHCN